MVAAENSRPNIILILADDLGYGAVGAYGQDKIQTPNIDSLVHDAMRVTQAYAGSSICMPSRSTLMTGLHTGHTPVRNNDPNQMLNESDVTIAEVLNSVGYATGAFGKWGLGFEGTSGHPQRQGFDEFFGQLLQKHAHFYYAFWLWHNEDRYPLDGNKNGQRRQYVSNVIHAKAKEFIRAHRDGPFFAYLSYMQPHFELAAPEEFERPYRGRFPVRSISHDKAGYLGSNDAFATFAGMVSSLDDHVGDILRLLDEIDIADNTIVVFTSDNGGEGGGPNRQWSEQIDFCKANGALRGYNSGFYDGGNRIPLIFRWPGHIVPGAESDYLTALWDLLPTFAEVSGAQLSGSVDGISLVPELTGAGVQSEHDGLYWERSKRYYRFFDRLNRSARLGRLKIIQRGFWRSIELYDIKMDVEERQNIALSILSWLIR